MFLVLEKLLLHLLATTHDHWLSSGFSVSTGLIVSPSGSHFLRERLVLVNLKIALIILPRVATISNVMQSLSDNKRVMSRHEDGKTLNNLGWLSRNGSLRHSRSILMIGSFPKIGKTEFIFPCLGTIRILQTKDKAVRVLNDSCFNSTAMRTRLRRVRVSFPSKSTPHQKRNHRNNRIGRCQVVYSYIKPL